MPSGMPLWLTLGKPTGTCRQCLTMTRNGNAITLAKRFTTNTRCRLRNAATPRRSTHMGMVHPSSMHNLLLRYWLASGGIDPDRDVLEDHSPAQDGGSASRK